MKVFNGGSFGQAGGNTKSTVFDPLSFSMLDVAVFGTQTGAAYCEAADQKLVSHSFSLLVLSGSTQRLGNIDPWSSSCGRLILRSCEGEGGGPE